MRSPSGPSVTKLCAGIARQSSRPSSSGSETKSLPELSRRLRV
jgi:hypothetical protein